ncbi:MAG: hypothetical protein IJX37_05375 [Oscillospiraceae bacterium]|nr:hypothetical protein [Oscillospiraceae bacterium]
MKEQIDTIPVNEAFETADECPFCYLERQVEQKAIRYTIGPGASYMEPDVRAATDSQGFCRQHYKKLYDYGNSLGNALVMQTYMVGLQKELKNQIAALAMPEKKGLFSKKQTEELPLLTWAKQKNSTCFLCSKVNYNMRRYYATFFHLIKDGEFRAKVEGSKGFCMHHFAQLLEVAQEKLPNSQIEWFYTTVCRLMQENLGRVQGDLDWFIDKFDYRNASAPWKNSKDAVSRSMQKLKGGHPADAPYKQD